MRGFTGVGSLDLLEPRLGRVRAAGGAPRAGALVGVPSLPKNRGTGASKQWAERLAKQSKLSTHGDEQRKQHNGLN